MASNYTFRFSFVCFFSVFVFTLFSKCGLWLNSSDLTRLSVFYLSNLKLEPFYLFVESQGNPEVDPVLYYIVGGPGCAALNGVLFQTGPLQFDDANYTGGLPTLHLYSYTWTKSASIIFADVPVGSGYSYSTNASDYSISDLESVNQSHVFIRKWLSEHPQFIPNRFFIATDSYSGILAPIIAQRILDDNEAGEEPSINLVVMLQNTYRGLAYLGIISGSPHTDGELEGNDTVPLAHQLGILSKCLEQINTEMVLAPKSATVSPKSDDENMRRSLKEKSRQFSLPSTIATDYWCKVIFDDVGDNLLEMGQVLLDIQN
ncbi:hypothetical protein Pint_32884 [Pistacia integerrima]|uniref:Uncharacterized protein n=1 Tax=Pistacia integerrima TaxID=434235 RepID=A0ACC0X4C9_9ROSI|nr:hypothetical protein Pint_32884 [Pistacia integerrima]